ncbi:MAG: hypothetical protein ABWK53_03255 [Anaerolineales bacterium]
MRVDRQNLAFLLLGAALTCLVCIVGAAGFAGGLLFGQASGKPTSFVVEVRADRGWQPAGLRVEAGDFLVITQVGGSWSECPDYGCPFRDGDGNLESELDQSNNVLSGCHHAALIGRLSAYDMICIGANYAAPARQSGWLELRINDNALDDNAGVLYVRVERR